jgi:hypothetical protein
MSIGTFSIDGISYILVCLHQIIYKCASTFTHVNRAHMRTSQVEMLREWL